MKFGKQRPTPEMHEHCCATANFNPNQQCTAQGVRGRKWPATTLSDPAKKTRLCTYSHTATVRQRFKIGIEWIMLTHFGLGATTQSMSIMTELAALYTTIAQFEGSGNNRIPPEQFHRRQQRELMPQIIPNNVTGIGA